MFTISLVFITLFLIQLVTATYAFLIRKSLHKTYSFPLGSQMDAANTLERYSRMYRQVNVRVHEEIATPALALEEFLIVNRNKVYYFDLFTNYYTLFQLELTKKEHNRIRTLSIMQNIFFTAEFILFLIGILTHFENNQVFGMFAIGFQTLCIISSLVGFSFLELALREVHIVAHDILDLDEVESARADALKNDLKYEVFEYPLDMIGKVVRFFIPSR